ncbi:MAG: STAS domain-containing protein [Methylococcus sp.]|nr:STAS domain-containing protein [Methylococcus sp.]
MRSSATPQRFFALHREAPGRYSVSGEMTYTTAPQALQRTAKLFRQPAPLVFDLHKVLRADSAGIALLIEWVRLARKGGVALSLENLPDQVENLVRVSGTGGLLSPCFGPSSKPTNT